MSAGNVIRRWVAGLKGNSASYIDLLAGEVIHLRPEADDTGALHVGDGTNDMDVKIFQGASTDYVLFDVGNKALTVAGATIVDVPAGQLQLSSVALTTTAAELNKLDDSLSSVLMSAGAGVSAAESYGGGVFRNGGLITTRIVVDLTGLVGSATDLDIIGNTGGAASANFGQITAARNGTIIGGAVTCLELPAGGADDIDFYSASVGTGAQDVIITDATIGTETALITSGGAWASGTTKGMTGAPTANDFLYIVNGEAAGGTFSAGKFLIELYGV